MEIFLIIFGCLQLFVGASFAKYVEGRLKTTEDWAFVARFCFISGRGRYEYDIEFDRRYGEPQLLLYFDDQSQWPAVYKTGKTCPQKLSVLRPEDNQIVTLSARSPYNMLSGCTIQRKIIESNSPVLPPPPVSSMDEVTTINPSYFDQFLKTTASTAATSTESLTDYELLNANFSMFNETDIFNASAFFDISSMRHPVVFQHDIAFENELENTTDFKQDVEELFETNHGGGEGEQFDKQKRVMNEDGNEARVRRSDRLHVGLFPPTRESIKVKCHNAGKFFSSRERWWYIAIANCGSEKGLDITYRFKMTNGAPGDFWHEHFSADEMLIPPILLTMCLAYTFLLVALFFCTVELKSLHLYHCTYRLFGFSVMLQWFGILIQGVAWGKYGATGLGPHITAGGLFMGASEITFLLLLLLMAKGYTITRARLSSCSTIKLTIFINTYIVAYIILFVYQAEAFDPAEVLNLYESPAGFGLAALRCASWGAFMISTANTIRKYPEKSSFYYPFGLFGSLWILGGPFLTIIGIAILDAWVRESVMCGTLGMMAFGGHAAFLWLTWPSRANKSFPYHVRTNHVGIASENDDGADYPRHTYEPSMVDQNIIIPLSRRTEELINGVYSQYLYEQHIYNTNPSAPPRHIPSYPKDPSDALQQHPPQQSNQSEQSINVENPQTLAIQSRLASYLTNPENSTENPPTYNDLDSQDSGHPSLNQSNSPSNETIETISNEDGDEKNSDEQPKQSDENQKNNPFVVNGIKRPPNKVILEPLEHGKSTTSNNVPKHLFAAKKLTQ